MFGNDFTYGSYKLSDFDMLIYAPENTQEFVSRDIDKAGITSVRPVPNHYSTHYSDALRLNFFVAKNHCNNVTQEDMRMSGSEINAVRAWLESPKTPQLLVVDMDVPYDEDEQEGSETVVNYFGVFTDVQPFVVNQECFGLNLTFTCDSPYGYSDIKESTYTLGIVDLLSEDSGNLLDESGNNVLGEGNAVNAPYVNDSAELNDYLRPIVKISSTGTFGSNEKLQIKNASDGNREMNLILPQGKSYILIDCQKKKITDNNGNIVPLSSIGLTLPISDDYNFVSAELYTFYWLRLLPGTNNISLSSSGTNTISNVKISARHIIKSGGF